MPLLLSLLIGLRFSRSHHRSGVESLISVFSILGIGIGVAVLIIGLSAMNGFERELKDRILSILPHGEITAIKQPWNNWNDEIIKILKIPGIIEAAPYINFMGLLENGSNLCLIQVKGINPKQEEKISTISKFVQKNVWMDFQPGKKQIIIGKGVGEILGLKQGDWISIMISNTSRISHKIQNPKRVSLHVVGVLQLSGQLGHNFAMIPLEDAREYLDMSNTNSITGIAIKVNDVFNANKLVRSAGEFINSDVYIKSWMSTYGYMYRDIRIIRTIIHFAMLLMIALASFNIVSILVMAVKNKSSDIAILRTFGAKDNLIRNIFVWYGLLNGFFGSLFGALIGILISLQLTPILNIIEKLIKHKFLSSNIYFIDFLPSELNWLDIIYVLITVFFLSLLASWYPAWRAVHINPAKVLSGR